MEKKLMQFKKKDIFLREQEEEENTQSENNESKSSSGFKDMVSILLHSQTQVHIFHLQTKSYS